MLPADLPEVERIGEAVHADFPERPEVFIERLALFAEGCWVTEGGYAIAHPARLGAPPSLDRLLGALPVEAEALHLHDVALLPAMRGHGAGTAAVALLRGVAARHRLAWFSLVAVHGAARYWARFGFSEATPADLSALASYGADARYMLAPAA